MKLHELNTLSMSPITRLAKSGLAHVIWRPSMRQWGKSVTPLIDIASNFRQIFVASAFRVFRTTFSIVLRVQTLKFWLLLPIVGDRVTGLAGFNWLIDPTGDPCAKNMTSPPRRKIPMRPSLKSKLRFDLTKSQSVTSN